MEGMKEWRAANKPELRGIIPNAMEHIFERVAADSGDETQFLIRCSYLEIYNEEVATCMLSGCFAMNTDGGADGDDDDDDDAIRACGMNDCVMNDQVRDLLAKSRKKGKLEIKSHPDKGVYVDGLTEVSITSNRATSRSTAKQCLTCLM